MSTPICISPIPMDEENEFIAMLEETIEESEYNKARADISSYLSVSQSLEGLLSNEKAIKHIKSFVIDERCEENILFLLDVNEYKKIYGDSNYSLNLKFLKIDKIVKQYLIPGESYSQLYIPLSIVNEFNKNYERWNKHSSERSISDLPPITLFDDIEKVVLERTSYQKFIRSPNIFHLLAMTVQDIKVKSSSQSV